MWGPDLKSTLRLPWMCSNMKQRGYLSLWKLCVGIGEWEVVCCGWQVSGAMCGKWSPFIMKWTSSMDSSVPHPMKVLQWVLCAVPMIPSSKTGLENVSPNVATTQVRLTNSTPQRWFGTRSWPIQWNSCWHKFLWRTNLKSLINRQLHSCSFGEFWWNWSKMTRFVASFGNCLVADACGWRNLS